VTIQDKLNMQRSSHTKYLLFTFNLGVFMLSLSLFSASAQAQITFTRIPNLPGKDYIMANSVSGDGSVVTGAVSYDIDFGSATFGYTDLDRAEAFRWTPTTGLTFLGSIQSPSAGSPLAAVPTDISANGKTIIGITSGNAPYLWTAEKGVVELKQSPSSSVPLNGTPHSIAPNGKYIVGSSSPYYDFTTNTIRQDSVIYDTQLQSVVTNSQIPDVTPIAVTSEGVIFGEEPRGLFRTPIGANLNEREIIPDLFSKIAAVSDDGKVIAGYGRNPQNNYVDEFYRWTVETGVVRLGDESTIGAFIPLSNANGINWGDISADGNTIIGAGTKARSFVWTAEKGILSLPSLFQDVGIDTNGFERWEPLSLSADGTTIVGRVNRYGEQEAFVARNEQGWGKRPTNNIPEPASLSLIVLGLGGAMVVKGRKRR
jgi:uncharacterized membrane protein